MKTCVKFLPDVASEMDDDYRALEKVGIKGVSVYRTDFNDTVVLTQQNAYVNLSHSKGIHMSRLVKPLIEGSKKLIEPDDGLLLELGESHGVDNAYWECKWDSMHQLDDVQGVKIGCNLEGMLVGDETSWFLTVLIPYTSICPCSADMVKQYGGIPHMQRAEALCTGQITSECELSDLIPSFVCDVLDAVKVYPVPYMKREDELAWCQNAGKWNLFVEDAARRVGEVSDKWFEDWVVACEHFETIHQHTVVGISRKEGGMLR